MNTNTNMNSNYETQDLYFAAYIKTIGVPWRGDRKDIKTGRVSFCFDTSNFPNFSEVREAYYSDTGKVSANKYAYEIKNLKSLCHSQTR